MELFFDVETTGLPKRGSSCFDLDAYSKARIVSMAWILRSKHEIVSQRYSIIQQEDSLAGPHISEPLGASYIHGINRCMTREFGKALSPVLKDFVSDVESSDIVIAHNLDFDIGVVASELYRLELDPSTLLNHKSHCTMKSNTGLVKKNFPNSKSLTTYKWPRLSELYEFCFHEPMKGAHNALADVENTAKCYYFVRDNVVDLTDDDCQP